jgi:hypothetical protein
VIAARTDALADWQVTVRNVIARPPQDIFALLTDVERMVGLGPEHRVARWPASRHRAVPRLIGVG